MLRVAFFTEKTDSLLIGSLAHSSHPGRVGAKIRSSSFAMMASCSRYKFEGNPESNGGWGGECEGAGGVSPKFW